MRSIAAAGALLLLALMSSGFASTPRCDSPPTLAFADGGIYTVRADGSRLHLLSRDGSYPAWAPDGSRIAYDVEQAATMGTGDVFVVRASGGTPSAVTRDGKGFLPGWSHDGRQLYFVDLNGGGQYVSNPDGSNRAEVPAGWFPESWSPDGRAYLAASRSALAVISGNRRRVLVRGVHLGGAVWAPKGDRVAYVDRERGLFVIRSSGRGRERLGRRQTWSPTWAPDGRRLAFVSGAAAGERTAIYVADTLTGTATRILRNHDADQLTWSPDGSLLAYVVGPIVTGLHTYDIWTVRPDGTAAHSLTGPLPLPRYEAANDPAWRPC